MKELQSVLSIVSDGLKTLAKGVEAIAEKVDEVSKSQEPKKAKTSTSTKKVKAVKKASKKKTATSATDTDQVLALIGRSKKGVSTATIMQKTGYNQKKIANIVYRLRKQKKIKSVDKGVYVKL